MDTLATPSAIVAGIAISAAVMTDVPPMLKWTLAIIAGGGAAAITQGATAFTRAHSTVFTAGLGNPVISTIELVGALLIAVIAIAAPYLALAALLVMFLVGVRMFRKVKRSNADS